MKKFSRLIPSLILVSSLILNSCYSVFSGGIGGRVVDAESESVPKNGIPDVDIYVYTNEKLRDEDFNNWDGNKFSPSEKNYFGHTITGNDGYFSLSKILWKSYASDFGKDADVGKIYLIFYHYNYGLTKGSTFVVSDSSGDTVYQELLAVRKNTFVTLNFIDVSTDNPTEESVFVQILVPESTESNPTALPKKLSGTVTGSGTFKISYPRYQSEQDKENQLESSPEISISYSQNVEENEVTWKACYNCENDDKNYAFMEQPSVTKKISGDNFTLRLYGKRTKIAMPVINGQYNNSGDSNDDGVQIFLKGKVNSSATEYLLDFGVTSTTANTVGTSGVQTHGNFTNLGAGYFWKDLDYTERYSSKNVAVFVADSLTPAKEMVLRSDVLNYTVQF